MASGDRVTSSVFGGTMNLLNTCVGGGTALVALPYAFAKLGIALGIFTFALFGVLVAFSLWLLIAAAEAVRKADASSVDASVNRPDEDSSLLASPSGTYSEHGRRGVMRGESLHLPGEDSSLLAAGPAPSPGMTYNELGRRAYGNAGLTMYNMTVCVNNTGMAVLFLDLLGSILPDLLRRLFDAPRDSWWLSRSCVLLAVTLALFPLLLFKHIEALKYASLVGIVAATVLVIVVLYAAVKDSHGLADMFVVVPEPSRPGQSVRDVFVGVPIIVFVYTCHYNMYSIYNGFAVSERAQRMWRVVRTTFALDFSLYAFFGLAGYFAFRSATQANIITQIASAHVVPDAVMDVVQLGFAIGCWLTLPLFNLECRVGFQYVWRQIAAQCGHRASVASKDLEQGQHDSAERPALTGVFLVETAALLLVFLGVALVVKDIGTVFGVIGATTATAITFVYPSLFFLRVVPPHERSVAVTRAAIALCAFGMIAGTISLAAAIDAMV